MTIAIGIKCDEGVVFCADRQITDATGLKYERDKILFRESKFEGRTASMMLTYSGNPDAATTVCDDLWEIIPQSRVSQIKRAIKSVLKTKYSKGLKTLIAISRANLEPTMYRTESEQVYDAQLEYIGAGDSSVFRYLAKLFFETHTRISMNYAKLAGSLLVSAANRSVEGCSGGPNLAVINQWGHIEKGGKDSAEKYLWGIERAEAVFAKAFSAIPVVELEAVPVESLLSDEDHKKADEIFARNKGTIMKVLTTGVSSLNKSRESRKP